MTAQEQPSRSHQLQWCPSYLSVKCHEYHSILNISYDILYIYVCVQIQRKKVAYISAIESASILVAFFTEWIFLGKFK